MQKNVAAATGYRRRRKEAAEGGELPAGEGFFVLLFVFNKK